MRPTRSILARPGPARVLVPDRTPRTIAFALLGAAVIGFPVALFAPDGPGWGIGTFVMLAVIWGLLAAFGTIQSLVAGPGWIAEKRAYRWHIVRSADVRRAYQALGSRERRRLATINCTAARIASLSPRGC